jgi:aryl-alcohol dehydrogenase-like predicted oxidoreductase
MDFNSKVILGQTGLLVGRLGISSSYGAHAEAFEEAFERGCNYFTWGTFIKGPSPKMKTAIRNIVHKGQRDKLVLALYAYTHSRFLNDMLLLKRLKQLGVDHADILILGFYSFRPARHIIEGALRLKEKGIIRQIGLSGHNRKLFPELIKDGKIDVFHVRYNAVNRGAETEIFPFLDKNTGQGIVSFTATKWGQLLNQNKMPPEVMAPSAVDCYRFVLSNPAVDVCMLGARNTEMMRENLATLDLGPMNDEELSKMKKIGDILKKA